MAAKETKEVKKTETKDTGVKDTASKEREKVLGMAISQIEKDFGKGAIMRFGTKERLAIDVISTGSITLDGALGVGGLPRGRVVEIFGPESSGKTTMSLHVIAEAQRRGGIAAFIDAEHALDPLYARKLGVDVDNLLISQPDFGEQALDIAETLVRSGAVDVIVIDSVAALVPKAEVEGDMGDSHVGLQARLMSQALRKLTAIIGKSKTVLIFVNQLREKIGVMFGNPEVTPGGRALKFYSSVRLDVRSIERLKDGDKIYGNKVRIKVVKNKVAPPFREAVLTLRHGEGIDKFSEILDLASTRGVVEKKGAWFVYKEEQIGQGFENARAYLKEHTKSLTKIEDELKSQAAVPVA